MHASPVVQTHSSPSLSLGHSIRRPLPSRPIRFYLQPSTTKIRKKIADNTPQRPERTPSRSPGAMQLSGCLLLSTLHPPIHPVAISMQFGSRESRLEKRTKRFDGMIERLTLDSATLTCVDNVRLRAVLRGVGEAGRVPDVRSSFQILYEDMAPIRMAADLIFPRLESTCDEAASQSQELPKSTSLAVSMDELDAARRLFDAIDADGGGSISKEELEESGLLSIINDGERETGDLTIDGFMEEADTDGDGDVSFVEFATYAASCEQLEGTDLIDVLAAVCKAAEPARTTTLTLSPNPNPNPKPNPGSDPSPGLLALTRRRCHPRPEGVRRRSRPARSSTRCSRRSTSGTASSASTSISLRRRASDACCSAASPAPKCLRCVARRPEGCGLRCVG